MKIWPCFKYSNANKNTRPGFCNTWDRYTMLKLHWSSRYLYFSIPIRWYEPGLKIKRMFKKRKLHQLKIRTQDYQVNLPILLVIFFISQIQAHVLLLNKILRSSSYSKHKFTWGLKAETISLFILLLGSLPVPYRACSITLFQLLRPMSRDRAQERP